MDTRAALGAAAAVAMTVTGGVSALFLTVGQAADASSPSSAEVTDVQYVDQFGNPVGAPTPEIVFVNPDGTPATGGPQPAIGSPAQQAEPNQPHQEYEEYEEHEEDEDDDGSEGGHENEDHEYEDLEYEDLEYEDHDDEGHGGDVDQYAEAEYDEAEYAEAGDPQVMSGRYNNG